MKLKLKRMKEPKFTCKTLTQKTTRKLEAKSTKEIQELQKTAQKT